MKYNVATTNFSFSLTIQIYPILQVLWDGDIVNIESQYGSLSENCISFINIEIIDQCD